MPVEKHIQYKPNQGQPSSHGFLEQETVLSFLVLVGLRYRFEGDFTIKLN